MASPLDPTASEMMKLDDRRIRDRRKDILDLNYLDKLRYSARGKNWMFGAVPAALLCWSFLSYALAPVKLRCWT